MFDNVIDWLLEENNPSVRYLTLLDLCKKTESDSDVIKAKGQIMEIGIVPKMLSKQNEDGSFTEVERFYLDKYKGTVWTLLILAELKADGSDERIKKSCEFILKYSQDKTTGGFSVQYGKKFEHGLPSMVIPCLTGNMVYALIKLGYLEDERVQQAIEWLVKYTRTDDGVYKEPRPEKYKKRTACFSKHSCFMGPAKALKALVAIPKEKRSNEINEKINELTEFFLIHHIYKKSHDITQTAKPGWLKLGFPLMYQTDILELLEIFSELEIKDNRLQDALDILKKKSQDGKWILENTFNGRYLTKIEEKHQTSKWITYKCKKILDYYD